MTTTVSDGSMLQDRVIVLTSAEDSAGEVFRFEYVARQVTPPLRDHVHTEAVRVRYEVSSSSSTLASFRSAVSKPWG